MNDLQNFLDKKVKEYNNPDFISNDPVQIPHRFTRKQDIEIAGFLSAIFAWGNRTTIINKATEVLLLMHNSPYEFCLHHTDADLKKLQAFRHRTFNSTDLLYFISFFRDHYSRSQTLEEAFLFRGISSATNLEEGLNQFYCRFFSLEDVPGRTKKHIASPMKKSTCKRINMFLRWMVRNDKAGVDFGLWKKIKPSQLLIPLDLHVARVARNLKLLKRKQTDWRSVVELTDSLKQFDTDDPVKYDFALFSLGISERF